jgi:hypothetical protein
LPQIASRPFGLHDIGYGRAIDQPLVVGVGQIGLFPEVGRFASGCYAMAGRGDTGLMDGEILRGCGLGRLGLEPGADRQAIRRADRRPEFLFCAGLLWLLSCVMIVAAAALIAPAENPEEP